MKKIKGLKKAVGDYQRANAGGHYSARYGKLMLNARTGELWTDEFYSLGHNSWAEYEDSDIIDLGYSIAEEAFYNTGSGIIQITMQTVKDYINRHYSGLTA